MRRVTRVCKTPKPHREKGKWKGKERVRRKRVNNVWKRTKWGERRETVGSAFPLLSLSLLATKHKVYHNRNQHHTTARCAHYISITGQRHHTRKQTHKPRCAGAYAHVHIYIYLYKHLPWLTHLSEFFLHQGLVTLQKCMHVCP
uniref:Uncharacterized protein n=1 Tax=Trypanosoma congolense (strain IL3000) TaxID=1068625 RepID=G0V159_TRYCI|nr:hypothetical protein, unlikely [Trypanosoma congolense IL3000]